jgi:hypothetical protein
MAEDNWMEIYRSYDAPELAEEVTQLKKDLRGSLSAQGSGSVSHQRDPAMLEKQAHVVSLATPEQVRQMADLLEKVRLPDNTPFEVGACLGIPALTALRAVLTDGGVAVTGAGVTAGLDFGLTMVAELRDQLYAEGTQLGCEYDPDPPFNAGSLRTASPEVREIMQSMYAGFPGQVRATLSRVSAGGL